MFRDGMVNILAYSAKYCFMDCEVLEKDIINVEL